MITENSCFKSIVLLFIIFCLGNASTKAQSVKTYTGSYTVGNSVGTATYQYIEDPSTGSRVFNGNFFIQERLRASSSKTFKATI